MMLYLYGIRKGKFLKMLNVEKLAPKSKEKKDWPCLFFADVTNLFANDLISSYVTNKRLVVSNTPT